MDVFCSRHFINNLLDLFGFINFTLLKLAISITNITRSFLAQINLPQK